MSAIKNIYYDIAMLSKLILLLPFVDDENFKLLNDSNIDDKLREFGLDCIPIYKIDSGPGSMEPLQDLSEPEFDFTPTIDTTQLCMPDPE